MTATPALEFLPSLPRCLPAGAPVDLVERRILPGRVARFTASGREALALILETLSRKRPAARRVILPVWTCSILRRVVEAVGLGPVEIDVDPSTAGLAPDRTADACTPDTLAIVAVHAFGARVPIERFRPAAERLGIAIVEDLAHALGADHEIPRENYCFGSFGRSKSFPIGCGGFATGPDLNASRRRLPAAPGWAEFLHAAGRFASTPAVLSLLERGEWLDRLPTGSARPLLRPKSETIARLAAERWRFWRDLLDEERRLRASLHPADALRVLPGFLSSGAAGPMLPALLRDGKERARTRKHLRDLGIGSLLPNADLPAPDPAAYPGAARLADRLLLLPWRGRISPDRLSQGLLSRFEEA